MIRYAALACLVLAARSEAQTIVVNTNVQLTVNDPNLDPMFGNTEFMVSKYVTPGIGCNSGGCFTVQSFQYENNTLALRVSSADEEGDWYLVQPGDTFTANTIANRSFPVIDDWTHPPQNEFATVDVGTSDFYLGVRTGIGYSPYDNYYYAPHRSVYGWVHLQPVNGALTMLGNVMAYDCTGIIVGSTTAVPEPPAMLLSILAVTVLLNCRLPSLRYRPRRS